MYLTVVRLEIVFMKQESAVQKFCTKEKIAQAASDLFSRKGFNAVSIRDICKEVGIKESTIYYHYTNKQAILDHLLEKIDSLIKAKRNAFDCAFHMAHTVSVEDMQLVAVNMLTDYLLHPYVQKVIAMLSIERMHNETAEEKYQRIVFVLPLTQQRKVFQQMIDQHMIQPTDARVVADLYYGAIYTAYLQHCMGENVTQARIDTACRQIRDAVGKLYTLLKTEKSV